MVPLVELWLPIVVSAVVVFVASYLMWMVLPHHRTDWKQLPNEAPVMEALERNGVGAGQYMFPYCSCPGDMKNPEWARKFETGPSGYLVVRPKGPMSMGKAMVLSLLYNLVVAVFVAYIAGRTLEPGEEYLAVFRVAGTAGFLAYAGGVAPASIWHGHSWSSTLKLMVDGLVYGLLAAGVFGWLWPEAAAV